MARIWLTLEQVSERMHIKAGTARNRLSQGEPMPPSVKVGRRRLFPEDAFERWMAKHFVHKRSLLVAGGRPKLRKPQVVVRAK
jgi:excisionase family DNA binding protein